jgi:hypothetical protein
MSDIITAVIALLAVAFAITLGVLLTDLWPSVRRNAWRDLWFREPLSKTWMPAQLLRNTAREELRRKSRPADTPEAAP